MLPTYCKGFLGHVLVIGLCFIAQTVYAQKSPYFISVRWFDLPEWMQDDFKDVGLALSQSCEVLSKDDAWERFCSRAEKYQHQPDRLRELIMSELQPYQVVNERKSNRGLVTGYYEPLLNGSFFPNAAYPHPLYARPDDLIEATAPIIVAGYDAPISRVKMENDQLVPYDTRAGLMQEGRLAGYELLWVSDPTELFFLQVQGSGRVQIEDGQIIRVGYADHNGYPYRSIGRILIQRGELASHQASMQRIRQWAKDNPAKVNELLAQNPRYIFFRIQDGNQDAGPVGSLGVPLTPERSIAVDRRYIPLGTPVYISTTMPNSTAPLNRLMFAQDTGNAIQGPVRADYFWGYGERAERLAGSMKQSVRLWVLLPKKDR